MPEVLLSHCASAVFTGTTHQPLARPGPGRRNDRVRGWGWGMNAGAPCKLKLTDHNPGREIKRKVNVFGEAGYGARPTRRSRATPSG